jgi:hypothetical protein
MFKFLELNMRDKNSIIERLIVPSTQSDFSSALSQFDTQDNNE